MLDIPIPGAIEKLTEAEFQTHVIAVAGMHGWWHLHIRNMQSNREIAGFPDLCFLRNREFRLFELKSIKGKERPSQMTFKAKVWPYGIDVHLLQPTPEDWVKMIGLLR